MMIVGSTQQERAQREEECKGRNGDIEGNSCCDLERPASLLRQYIFYAIQTLPSELDAVGSRRAT